MLKYNDFALSKTVEEILQEDLWVFNGYNALMFSFSKGEPVKFSAYASVYLRKGSCKVLLSLRQMEIKAPAVVSIREGEILQLFECSDDLDASVCVMSKHFTETLFASTNELSTISATNKARFIRISDDLVDSFDSFYSDLKRLIEDNSLQRRFLCLLYTVLAFYYRIGDRLFANVTESHGDSASRLTEFFLYLVQQNFREERFLDFYAKSLGITSKHLSRVIKAQTGLSPVDWIERYVILEAKVLLRSSTLTIQQIADTLHFSSQSFFGKHFKKHTGKTPGEFRNL